MMSLTELRRTADLLEPVLTDSKLQRINQVDDFTLVLEFYGWDEELQTGAKKWLTLNVNPKLGYVAPAPELPEALPWPPEFAATLKKRIQRGKCAGVRIVNDDRMVALLIEGKEGSFELVLSLMGPRSNVYLLDLDGKLLGALRPLEKTRSELKLGEAFTNPPRPEGASEGDDRWADLPDTEFLAAVRDHYAGEFAKLEFRKLKDRVAKALKKEFDFAERRTDKIEKDLDDARDAREKKHMGELLKQVMGNVEPGDSHVVATDYDTGEDVQIPLDPQLSPSENLERYFKKYHKGLVGTNMLGQQLEITKSHRNDLTKLRDELGSIEDIGALRKFAARPLVKELCDKHCPEEKPRRPPKKKPEKKDVPGKLRPRRYATSDELEVWVGKSDEGNDYLTTKLANGNDWFFHVQGHPGSHTVLRTGGRKDPPQESVLEAAELCVNFSKLKDAKRVSVHIAPIKYVNKPKGAKPGLVYVSQGKTIDLRRDPKRLKRILDARVK